MDRLLCGDVGQQDRGRDARALQMRPRRQAGRLPRADDDPRGPALPTLKRRFAAFPVTLDLLSRFRTKRRSRRSWGAFGGDARRRRRDAPDPVEGREVLRPRSSRRGRGAALRRRAQGADQGMARLRRRPRDVRDADPALAPPLARRHPRPLRHRDAAEGSPRDRHARRPDGRRGHPGGDPRRGGPRRAGLRRAQPDRVARPLAGAARDPRPRREGRERPRPDVRGGARARDAGVRDARGGSSPRDDDRREWSRHPLGDHHDHRPRRPLRAPPALPAARRRATRAASWAPRPACDASPDDARRAGAIQVFRPRGGLRSPPGPRDPRRGEITGGEQSGHIESVGFDLRNSSRRWRR